MWSLSTFRLMKSLKPIDMLEIVTRGVCSEHIEVVKKETIEVYGEWYLNNWKDDRIKFETLKIYLSDMGFSLLTTKEEAIRLSEVFKSWGVYQVGYEWYSGRYYKVGFQYDFEDFNSFYNEWLRNKKLEELGI
jgi:hypothetical protein